MKKILSFVLAAVLLVSAVPTVSATNDYSQGTQVVYEATGSESYTITVPAQLAPGGNGTVTLSGTWADNRVVTVTADPSVTLTNSIKADDQKVLDISFAGISEKGSNTGSQTFTEDVSVAEIKDALFGTWSGKFNYNVDVTSTGTNVELPEGYVWDNGEFPLLGKIKKSGTSYTVAFDVSAVKPTGKTYYVDCINGSDDNEGTYEAPLKTIRAAYNKSDVVEITLFPGVYTRDDSITDYITKTISITTVNNEKAVIANCETKTWSKEDAYDNVYSTTWTDTSTVIDAKQKDTNGNYLRLKEVTSLSECNETENSYYLETGSKVYVHIKNGAEPTRELWVMNNARGFAVSAKASSSNKTVYFENIEFVGGYSACVVQCQSTSTYELSAYFKNCVFSNGSASNTTNKANGLTVNNAHTVILQGCLAEYNEQDGFNYHNGATWAMNVIEIDCTGRYNGIDGNDNGSSIHDGGKIVRINGQYYGNTGTNVIDINENTMSWNVNCTTYDAGQNYHDFSFEEGPVYAWLENCESTSELSLRALTNAQILLKDCNLQGTIAEKGGTIGEYK